MAAVRLAARYGRIVQVDVCDGCGGLWFDDAESQQLTPGATLALLERVTLRPSRAVQDRSPCPRCRQTLYRGARPAARDEVHLSSLSLRSRPLHHGLSLPAREAPRAGTHADRDRRSPGAHPADQLRQLRRSGRPGRRLRVRPLRHAGLDGRSPATASRTGDAASCRRREPRSSIRRCRSGCWKHVPPPSAPGPAWPANRSWVDDLMADDGGIAQAAIRLLGMRVR